MRPIKFKTTPYPIQQQIAEQSLDFPYCAYLLEMGMGKTKVLLDVAANLFLQQKINALLVVAPLSLLRNYNNEVTQHLLDEVPFLFYAYRSKTAATKTEAANRQQLSQATIFDQQLLKIVVINPEALLSKKAYDFCKELLASHQTLFAVDEAGTILKNIKTKQAKTLVQLAKLAPYRRIMTGTPITQSPLDLFAQYGFLDPSILGYRTFTAFRAQYAILNHRYGGSRSFLEIKGYKNLEHLIEKVKPFTFYALKKDFLDLPAKIFESRYVSLSPEQRRLYDNLKRNNVAFLDTAYYDEKELVNYYVNRIGSRTILSVTNVLAKLTRLQQIISGYYVIDDNQETLIPIHVGTINPRLYALKAILEELPHDEKVIIWCKYIQEIKDIQKFLGEAAVSVFGATPEKDRQEFFEHFKKEAPPSPIKYLVANPKVAGIGLTLNGASKVIYYSQDFSLETRLQSEDRCHRIGQDKPVVYIDIIAENTIDEYIREALSRKTEYTKIMHTIKMEAV